LVPENKKGSMKCAKQYKVTKKAEEFRTTSWNVVPK